MTATEQARASSDTEDRPAGEATGQQVPPLELVEPIERDGPLTRTNRTSAALAAIRHHRRWVVAVVLIVLAATLIAYALIPRRFTVQADLWLDHGFERLGPAAPPTAASSASPLARNTEVRLLTSTDLAAAVVDRLGLANVRGVGQPQDGPLVPRATARRMAIESVRENLQVETSGTSYATAVRYTAREPVVATGILNHLIDSYVADRRSGGERGRERVAMQAQVAAARDATIRDEAAMGGYREAIGLGRSARDRRLIQAEIASFNAAIRTLVGDQRAAMARLREAQGWGTGGAAGGRITSPRIRDLRARQAQAAAVRDPFGLDGGASARAAELARELAVEVRRVRQLSNDVRAARTRTGLLRAARNRASEELKAADAAAGQLRQIGDRAAAAKARYADFAQRYQALVATQRSDRGTAYVISRGSAREARSFPDPISFALGGLIAAALAAGGVVLLLEALTKGFRSRHHLERVLGLPVIGMVPDLARVRDADLPADDPMGPPDYLYNNRHSPFSAAFRAIHTGLRLGISGKSLRSIAICSALQEEGKTTVAICLARSAALAGLRVVLVDCDARRPAASRALSPYTETGLAHVLEDGIEFRQVVQCDTPSGAWFLAQGSSRLVANGTVASPKMAGLIAQLERSYDLVLLDTAPALALSEARELAAMADGVLLVARARKTPVEATRIAKDLLEQAGARVVAATMTMVDP